MNQTTVENSMRSPALSPQESVRLLDSEIAALRGELAGLVVELDRRRHELLDVKLQARRHALGMTLTAVALLAAASGFVRLAAWRSRRRHATLSRIGRLREALSRIVPRPQRVAASVPPRSLPQRQALRDAVPQQEVAAALAPDGLSMTKRHHP